MSVRALIVAVLCFLTFNAGVLGATIESRELGLVDVPPCGLLCMLSTVPASGCALDDINCVCSNDRLAQTLSACMLVNCTMADNQNTARVQASLCHLSEESKRTEVFLYTGIVYSLAFLFVVLRIAGKLVSKRLALDDLIVVTALLLTAVPLGCVLAMTKLGFGEHLWNLEDGMLLPILRFFYISWSTYVVVLALIKVSLIIFYLEIFKSRRFEICAYIVLTYIIINTLIIFFLTIFNCNPVSSFWNRDIKGQCMNIQALAYANSASALAQDFVLLILPILFIRNLNMKRYRKIAVGFMFAVGTFGCIATIVRLQTLLAFKISIDPTWDYVPVTVWTELELAAGFLCVSLPSIRILIVRILPVQVKEFLSQITQGSSKGDRMQKQVTPPGLLQKEWQKPANWSLNNVSLDAPENAERSRPRKSFLSGLWPSSPVWPMSPGSHLSSHTRNGSRRLHSALSNYSESGVAVTRPPYRERRRTEDAHVPVELLNVPENSAKSLGRHSCKSCGSLGDQVTALPPIGCLPERSYSDLDLTRDFRGLDRKWSREDRGMCQ